MRAAQYLERGIPPEINKNDVIAASQVEPLTNPCSKRGIGLRKENEHSPVDPALKETRITLTLLDVLIFWSATSRSGFFIDPSTSPNDSVDGCEHA